MDKETSNLFVIVLALVPLGIFLWGALLCVVFQAWFELFGKE
jgi:hypothetical protein